MSGKWEKPPVEGLKISCDGALKLVDMNGSFSVVFRGHDGLLIDGFCGDILASSLICIEAASLRAGMLLVIQSQYSSITFEADSLELLGALQDDTRVPWQISALISELTAPRSSFPSWKIFYVS